MAIPPLSGTRMAIRSLKDRGFMVEAPRIFNSLLDHIRSFEGSPMALKGMLDRVLQGIPDTHLSDTRVCFATDDLGAQSNGLRHWLRVLGSQSYSAYLHNLTQPLAPVPVMGGMGHLITQELSPPPASS